MSITKSADGVCYDVAWQTKTLDRLMDCIDIGTAQVIDLVQYSFLEKKPMYSLLEHSLVWWPRREVSAFPNEGKQLQD